MNYATVTPDTLATTLARGISSNLEGLIREQLQPQIDAIVAGLVKRIAERATVAVESMHDVRGMGLIFRIAINGVETKL